MVDAAVVAGRYELPRLKDMRYHGFVDPSGGSSDSMTLAVAHTTGNNRIIIDAIRERRQEPSVSRPAAFTEQRAL